MQAVQPPEKEPSDPAGYQAGVLRLWRDGPGAAWRASLQVAESGQRIGLADLDHLFGELLWLTNETPDERGTAITTKGEHPNTKEHTPMRTHPRPSILGRLRGLMLALALILVPLLGLTPSQTYAATPGTVVGWGDNTYGQVTIPAGLSNVTAIATGGGRSLALKSDGTVVAWGNNVLGLHTVPAGLSNVTAIAAGASHSLALKSDGTVVGWGSAISPSTIPAGLSNVTAIDAGANYSLALKSDGMVVAWGSNSNGELNMPAGLSGVTAIAAGTFHSLALKSDGTVVGWGNNGYGQLNIPAGLSNVTAIAAGTCFSLALKSDGSVISWGLNGYVPPASAKSGVIAIAAGNSHALALKSDGTVVGWGNNNYGQSTIPAGLSHVTAISAGAGHSLAISTPPPDSTPPATSANG